VHSLAAAAGDQKPVCHIAPAPRKSAALSRWDTAQATVRPPDKQHISL